jgi:hypothetical protein
VTVGLVDARSKLAAVIRSIDDLLCTGLTIRKLTTATAGQNTCRIYLAFVDGHQNGSGSMLLRLDSRQLINARACEIEST